MNNPNCYKEYFGRVEPASRERVINIDCINRASLYILLQGRDFLEKIR